MRNQSGAVSNWGERGTAAATFGARLTFENVSLKFAAIEAVHDVSFELQAGEIVCLLGPSGCGKTSLLRIAAGIQRPTAGTVRLDGEAVSAPGLMVPPEKRNIGLMFQDFALFPHLSIIDNIAFGLRNLDRKTRKAEARLALQRVGLDRFENGFPGSLSGGEQQRVALARAIVPRPAVMLMDEPFSGLDQRLRESVRQETLALLRETRASCMLVTHDPAEALGMSDRILLMREGQLVQIGTPQELYHQPADLEAAKFFSDVNELNATVHQGAALTPLGRFPAPGLEDGAGVTVLVRPQGIRLVRSGESGISGHVLASRFLGDTYELTVQVAELVQPVLVRTALGDVPRRGQSMEFTIDPTHVLVFETNLS